LQLYGEIALEPLARAMNRTRSLFLAPEDERPPKQIEEELERLESRFEIFKIRLFQEYRQYVFFNLTVASILAVVLTVIAYKADDAITDGYFWTTIAITGASILPGPISLATLWFDASWQAKPIREAADDLEKRATASVGER
jgi:hypothetical protein